MSEWNPTGTYQYRWFQEFTLPTWRSLLLPHLGRVNAYLEIGVSEALSFRWVLEHLKPADADGVDPYWPARQFGDHPREAQQRKQRAIDNLMLWGGEVFAGDYDVTFRKGEPGEYQCATLSFKSSEQFLVDAGPSAEYYDLIYIDGNHNASDALLDVVLSWRLLKTGGVMIVDDVDQRYRGNRPRAWHAADAFERCFDSLFDTLYKTHRQFAYRKIERRRKGSPPGLVIAQS
jgi:hypothetical protein